MNLLYNIENTAEKYAEKTAVSMRDESVTFSELRDEAKRLAVAIAAQCGSGGRAVGVFANRCVKTIVRFVAVLYSGNFYVPIDPDMPKEKLASVIADAGIRLILGEESNAARADEAGYGGKLMSGLGAAGEYAFPSVDERSPLYMVYTSGSTGKPKGVLKSHGAMMSFTEAYRETFGFSSDEVIGNQSPFFFDASAKDVYMMLTTGATLEIIPTELFAMPPMLVEYMNEKKITFASWVPSAISIVARLSPFSLVKPKYLRRLFFVGEAMPVKHLRTWMEALPDVEYVNLYGQSEIAGICCYYRVLSTEGMESVPIGKPLKNCKLYLFDAGSGSTIAAADRVGEIVIVSPALADGYYGDRERTDAVFTHMDFGEGEVRCFRSGDLAKFDGGGNLVFAARSDYQIKHMGHRIELGEIETVACGYPGIANSCCLYSAAASRIVLFCERERGADVSDKEMRAYLKEKLSFYMVPGKIILTDKLPVNANGKIDRRALGATL